MNEKTTACDCPFAKGEGGFCNRHNIVKNPHFVHLCQTNQKYFLQWEQCRGIGQEFIDCAKNTNTSINKPLPPKKSCNCKQNEIVADPPKPTQEELKANLPSLWQQAKNFGGAMIAHALNGFKGTPEELQKKRLEICEKCPLFILNERRCGACGCLVDMKTRHESSQCPRGHW